MMSNKKVVVMHFERDQYSHLASTTRKDIRICVAQYAGFSTADVDVPNVRQDLYNSSELNLNLLEGYNPLAPGLDRSTDRHCGLLHNFQLALINLSGGSAMVNRCGGFKKQTLLNSNFVSSRSALVRIGMRLYDSRETFRIVAVRRSGVTFIHELPSENTQQNHVLENQYVGHRFRQIMTTTDDPHLVSDFEDHHYGIQSIQLGKINVLARSVVDCVTDQIEFEYVELKTHRTRNFGTLPDYGIGWMKSVRWWLQMTLTGMQRLVVGVRDEQDTLKETIKASSRSFLPPDFNCKAMMVFLEDSLEHIERYMSSVPEGSQIIFTDGGPNELCATRADRDYDIFHPSFERLLK